MADKPKKLTIIDNPAVAESYANKLIAASFDGGAVVVTLGVTRFLPEANGKNPKDAALAPVHVTTRLAISPAGAVELANALTTMLKALNQMQQKTAAGKLNKEPSNL
jgi:hypothetical protein